MRLEIRNPANLKSNLYELTPQIVEDGYNGFNIFYFDTRYFAILQKEGVFNIQAFWDNKYSNLLIAHTINELKKEIDWICSNKSTLGNKMGRKRQKALFLCNVISEKITGFLSKLKNYEIVLLTSKDQNNFKSGFKIIKYCNLSGKPSNIFDITNTSTELLKILKNNNYDLVIIPFNRKTFWKGVNLENFSAAISDRLMIMFSNGKMKLYKGEDIRRIQYNKAYLNSMFRFVPQLKGKRILEVGCSDGLACDLLLSEDPEKIIGIDTMKITGCGYGDPKIEYFKMDAHNLLFEDKKFDLCYSIATLEHCRDPLVVLKEMKKVTKRGGFCYVQAGPLYYSPFGHHMFEYFKNYPWIHLRLSKEEIIAYCVQHGIDIKVKETYGRDIQNYINRMINTDHINGRSFEEYKLDEFMASPDIEILNFSRSYEGESLLTENIKDELRHIPREVLLSHGFELVFRIK